MSPQFCDLTLAEAAELGSVHDGHGPRLQMAMFEAGITPDAADVAEVADQARRLSLAGRKNPATHD